MAEDGNNQNGVQISGLPEGAQPNKIGYGISPEGDKVLIRFDKPTTWATFEPDQAVHLAFELVRLAGKIKGTPMTMRVARTQ